MNKQNIAGLLVFVGVFIFSLSIMIDEALRPSFSINSGYISDLGVGPNADLFNYTIILMGAMIVISGAILLYGKIKEPWVFGIILVGIGAMGVGIFPGNVNPTFHSYSALIAFIMSGVTAVLFSIHKGTALRVLSPIAGALILVSVYLFTVGKFYGLGPGGMERLIVYPVLLWALALSGHLMNQRE